MQKWINKQILWYIVKPSKSYKILWYIFLVISPSTTIHKGKHKVISFSRIFYLIYYFLLLENGENGAPGVMKRLWLTSDYSQHDQNMSSQQVLTNCQTKILRKQGSKHTVQRCCSLFYACHFTCCWRVNWNKNHLHSFRPGFVFERAVGKHPCVWPSNVAFMLRHPFTFFCEWLFVSACQLLSFQILPDESMK